MDILSGLMHGFAVALEPANLLWCFVGVVLGTVVGVMPGLGPPATIAMLLPLTFLMNPAGAMIMLAGIYYGAKYGGSTTSILLRGLARAAPARPSASRRSPRSSPVPSG
jgi:putative tricarboxylic transport membrane protein